jgi:RNA recognition motif-containing protein
MKLFVAGFPNDFDDIDLKEMFELYGEVVSAKLVTDRATGKSKGFGFIDMPDKTEAQQTIEALHGAVIKGKKISVQEAEDKPKNNNFGRNPNDRFNRNPNDRFNKRY